MRLSMRAVASVLWAVVVLPGCGNPGNAGNPPVDREAKMRRISSAAEWTRFFQEQVVARQDQPIDICLEGRGFVENDVAPGFLAPAAPGAVTDGDSAAGEGQAEPPSGFSGTNLQEAGVDEADIVKSDGRYLYILSGSELKIVSAPSDAGLEEMSTLALTDLGFSNAQLYLNGDRLIAIMQPHVFYYPAEPGIIGGGRGEPGVGAPPSGGVSSDPGVAVDAPDADVPPGDIAIAPFPYEYRNRTEVILLDLADRRAPAIEARWHFDGSYADSRMIDGMLHLILSQYPEIPFPMEGQTLTVDDVSRFIPKYDVTFADGSTGSGEMVRFEDFYRPVQPDGYGITTVISLDTNTVADAFSSLAIMADPGTIYSSRAALYLTDAAFGGFCEYRETLDIHKFTFTDRGLEYAASGSVEGRLVNQFALSEHDGALRVAVTTGQPWAWDGSTSQNHVFVLQQNGDQLTVSGAVRDLAAGEQIYAARFVGDRGFLVTFRQIDPLFTLDLSDPAAPQLVGELKVPGFSQYIHPLDDDHLLTFGRAATEEGVVQALQLSLFDVSDFANPRLITAKSLGGRGSYSEAEFNHKAFNYYPEQGLLAIPVQLYDYGDIFVDFDYGGPAFAGVQFYRIDPAAGEAGIELRGQISTAAEGPGGFAQYYGWSRGLFIGNRAYAVTELEVKSSAITAPGEVLDSLTLRELPPIIGGGDGGEKPIDAPGVATPVDPRFE